MIEIVVNWLLGALLIFAGVGAFLLVFIIGALLSEKVADLWT